MSLFSHVQPDEGNTAITLMPGPDGGLIVPDAQQLFEADFQRAGSDLYLLNKGVISLRIADYFNSDHPADIYAVNGAVLRGDVVTRLAGPLTPGQYVQSGARDGAEAIGQVETLDGDSSVQRADGTVEVLTVGKKIFENDLLQTGPDSTVSVTFVDGTIFSLSANSRMVIDYLVYDPSSNSNSGSFNLVQGGFVFIAGQVAKTGGMDVNTPSATMGIRGTTVIADVQMVNGVLTTEVSLSRDPDGDVGEIVLRDLDGNIVANITGTDIKWLLTTEGQVFEVTRSLQDDADDSFLIAEAVGAYRSAFARVDSGETFVTFGDTRGGRNGGAPVTGTGSGLELDSVDEPGRTAPDVVPETDGNGDDSAPFDDGNLNIEDDFFATDTVVAGFEDPSTGAITGSVPIGNADVSALEFTIVQAPVNGTVTISQDGSFEYVPVPNFNGEDQFTYRVIGAGGIDSTGTVLVELVPVNDVPEFKNSVVQVSEDGSITQMLVATDVDGDALSYSLERPATNGGMVLLADGTYNYTPDADFSGADSFSVRATDPDGASVVANISVTVAAINDMPTIVESRSVFSANVDEAAAETVGGTLTAQDADTGDMLTWSGSAIGTYGTFEITAAGIWQYTLSSENADSLVEGEVVFDRFLATVTDSSRATDTQEITVTITGTNDVPEIGGVTAGKVTEEDAAATLTTGGALTITDVDAGEAVFQVQTGAVGSNGYGSFDLLANGTWSYSADNSQTAIQALGAGDEVTDSFTAISADGSANEVVTVTITGTNDVPRMTTAPGGDAGLLTEGTDIASVTGQLSATDPDNGAVVTWRGSAAGTYGEFEVSEDGSWIYTLNASAEALSVGDIETETFEVFVTDGQGAEVQQFVTIEIVGLNQSPMVRGTTIVEAIQDTPLLGQLTATDAETIEGDLAFALGLNGPSQGDLVMNSDGSYEYRPNEGFLGLDRFEYTVTDSDGAVTTARVEVEVESESGFGDEGRAVTLAINTEATETAASGSVAITSIRADTNTINLSIAMDRSGSIGAAGWEDQVDAVLEALQNLARTFDGASNQVMVQVITYATTTISYRPFELQDFDLARSTLIESYDGGGTRWDRALAEAQSFFENNNPNPSNETNYLFFITDGVPTEPRSLPADQGWRALSDDLRTDGGDGYSVFIEAFGIGPAYDVENPPQRLTDLAGRTPTFLADSSLLGAVLDASPLFNPTLIDFELTLEVDGREALVIADENSPAFATNSLEYELALAEIADIHLLLGENNRFSATARFDLDGDPETPEIELFSTEVFGNAGVAQILNGMAENDLLFGSQEEDQISSGGGNDVIIGLSGDDTLNGGLGQDTILAGDGDDLIVLSVLPIGADERIDGGSGVDTLRVAVTGSIDDDVLLMLDLSGIEVLDMDNGQANSLNLVTLADVFDLSGTADQEITDLLNGPAVANVSVYGDADDNVELENTAATQFIRANGITVDDGSGTVMDIYQYFENGGLMATLGIDAEVEVTVVVA
ncbi:VCBS domain-containing protein [Sulfitobacter sp. SK012]|uniref:VCBS domain-containing protein n=1 Tax=Sulfitobacter sp. SK012 TaxID=1389005 RepID=UPI0013B3A0DA|nr:VCBS domain-containing protein [Sulfitobacter sp. SK012]